MLVAMGEGGRVRAGVARREAPHRCPGCGAGVTLRRGERVIAHFAHRPGSGCAYAHGETAEHLGAKAALAEAFSARGLLAEIEAEVLSGEGDRRADVLVTDPARGVRVAIEVQHSALSLEAIERRTRAYTAAGVAVIWIPTLGPGQLAGAGPQTAMVTSRRTRIPEWLRFAFALHGALWHWTPGGLRRGWLAEAVSEARDEAAVSRPGWRGVLFERAVPAAAVRLKRRAHLPGTHERFALGVGAAANLLAPGETAQPPSPVMFRWRAFDGAPAPVLTRPHLFARGPHAPGTPHGRYREGLAAVRPAPALARAA